MSVNATSPKQSRPLKTHSVEEASDAAGISRAETFRLIKSGRLRSLKIGRRRLILVADLEAFLASLATRRRERGEGARRPPRRHQS